MEIFSNLNNHIYLIKHSERGTDESQDSWKILPCTNRYVVLYKKLAIDLWLSKRIILFFNQIQLTLFCDLIPLYLYTLFHINNLFPYLINRLLILHLIELFFFLYF